MNSKRLGSFAVKKRGPITLRACGRDGCAAGKIGTWVSFRTERCCRCGDVVDRGNVVREVRA